MTIVYIISAPSGSGKSTLVNEIRKIVPDLDFSISYTTRAPRGSEQNGREYFFVPRADFADMLRKGDFLESAEVHGNYYGTSRGVLRKAEQAGKDLVLDIDVQGAAQMKEQIKDAVSIFILPPDRQTLEWRLRQRDQDAEDEIGRRLDTAKREIENYEKYAYILVNDHLERAVDQLTAIFLAERQKRSGKTLSPDDLQILARAESCRVSKAKQLVEPILATFGR